MTRKPLGRGKYGPHGQSVSLRLEGDRIVATWRAQGVRTRKTWPNTATHRKEAVAWAEAFAAARLAPAATRRLVTTEELWQRYAATEFATLRPKTVALYTEAWRGWAVFVGEESVAEDQGPETVGRWRTDCAALAPNTFHRRLQVVKTVYAWGYRHRVIARNDVREYRFKVAKEARRERPAEYRSEDFRAILAQLSTEGAGTWRAHVAVALCGLQGVRQNAVLHLRWEDVDLEAGTVTWRARWDKVGREWSQPLRPASIAALRVALKHWSGGDWVFPAANSRSRREVWSAQSLWRQIRQAEQAAGVEHLAYRGAHGLRRMVFNDALAAGADVAAAMAVIGDRDLKVASAYLRPRHDAVAAAFALLDAKEAE